MGGLFSRREYPRDPQYLIADTMDLEITPGNTIQVHAYLSMDTQHLIHKPFIMDAAKAMQMQHPRARCTACGKYVDENRVRQGAHAFLRHDQNAPYHWMGYFCPDCILKPNPLKDRKE